MLKMICRDASPSCSRHNSASSIDSTLAPNRLILPASRRARSQSKTSPRRICSVGMQCSCVRSSTSTPRRVERRFGVLAEHRLGVIRFAFGDGKTAEFGGDEHGFRTLLQNLADQPSRCGRSVDVGGIEERDAVVERGVRICSAVSSLMSPQQMPSSCQQPRPISETAAPDFPNSLACMRSPFSKEVSRLPRDGSFLIR
jgi:hypothetical protein